MITDYESWGAQPVPMPPTLAKAPAHFSIFEYHGDQFGQEERDLLIEAYSGVEIVSWYGTIERQLEEMIDKSEAQRNHPYADQVREYLKTWRANEISGSMNREVLETLKAAASQLAVTEWKYRNYFSNLRDQLRKLIASEEELPREPQQPQKPKGGRGGAPEAPMGDYGPTDEQPNGVEGGDTAMPGGNGGAMSAGGNSNV